MFSLLSVAITFLILWLLYRSTRKPTSFPPGPARLPFVGGLFYFRKIGRGPLHGLLKVVKDYGKVAGFWIGNQPIVVVSDYELLKDVFNVEATAARPPITPLNEGFIGWRLVGEVNKGRPPGVGFSHGNYWRDQRRFLLRTLRDFGFGKRSMEGILMEQVEALCQNFSEKAGQMISLDHAVNITVVNALWSIVVGEQFDINDPAAIKTIEKFQNLIKNTPGPLTPLTYFLPDPNLVKLPGLRQIAKLDERKNAFEAISDIVRPLIEEHKRTLDPDNIRDVVDGFLAEIEATNDTKAVFYGERGISTAVANVSVLFFAGMETTTSTLKWLFLYLMHHPEMKQKIHDELDKVVGRDRWPSFTDEAELHYTRAFILESMRLTCFAFLGGIPHYTLQDVAVGDYIVPKGTIIAASLVHVMRDAERFAMPNTLRPERFLSEDGKFMPDDHVIPFGIGKRICLGKALAEKEIFLFFSSIMQKFDIHPAPLKPLPGYGLEDTNPVSPLRVCPHYEVIMTPRG